VEGLSAEFLTSSLTSLVDLIEDELIPLPLPMRVVCKNTDITLKVWRVLQMVVNMFNI